MWLFVFLVVLGVAVAGFAIVWHRRGAARYQQASQTWQRGEATIVEARYERVAQSNGKGGTVVSWRPIIRYRYGAAGEHEGDRPFLNAKSYMSDERRAQEWTARYPAGARVPVWWDPQDPTQAALELNAPSRTVLAVLGVTGTACALFGLYLLAVAPR